MIINFDDCLADGESPTKVVRNDLFISHRRSDVPNVWLRSLARTDIRVTWDNDLDVRDRHIEHAINIAMLHSTHVGLFVSECYTDSPWCRAEYLGAVRCDRKLAASRALVLLASEKARERVPSELSDCRSFKPTTKGIASLVSLLLSEREWLDRHTEIPESWLMADMSALSAAERLYILQQRVEYWSETGTPKVSTAKRQRMQLMTASDEPNSEVESVIRDIGRIVFGRDPQEVVSSGTTPDWGVAELEQVVAIAFGILAFYCNAIRPPKIRASWLWGYLLRPLLMAVCANARKSDAISAYLAIIHKMSTGRDSANVPAYRDALLDVQGGDQLDSVATRVSLRLVGT